MAGCSFASFPQSLVDYLISDCSLVQEREVVFWSPSSQVVVARKQQRLGSLVLSEEPIKRISDDQALPVLMKVGRSGSTV